MMKKIILLAGVASVFAFAASAEAASIRPYVGVKGGAAMQYADDIDFAGQSVKKVDETKFFASGEVGLAFGLPAGQLRTEVEYTYRSEFKGTEATTFGAKAKTQSLFLNVYYDLPVKWVVVPYVEAGVGYTKAEMKLADLGYKKSKNFIGWNVGAGVAYNFNKHVALDLGYRYADLGKFKDKGAGVETKLYNHEFYLGLRYTF